MSLFLSLTTVSVGAYGAWHSSSGWYVRGAWVLWAFCGVLGLVGTLLSVGLWVSDDRVVIITVAGLVRWSAPLGTIRQAEVFAQKNRNWRSVALRNVDGTLKVVHPISQHVLAGESTMWEYARRVNQAIEQARTAGTAS